MSNSFGVIIGNAASGNSMVISNGGTVFDRNGIVGSPSSSGNSVEVVGTGSVWSNTTRVTIGGGSSSNSLLIADAAKVFDVSGVVGSGGNANTNSVQVMTNGLWRNGVLTVGNGGSKNSLVINGGSVSATSLTVRPGSTTCDNLVELDNGNLTVTNNGAGVLDVRNGQLTLNGGVLQVDNLVITNSCASFVHTGGTLIAGTVVLDPNTFHIVSATPQGNDVLVT